jgi:hypothetical protein
MPWRSSDQRRTPASIGEEESSFIPSFLGRLVRIPLRLSVSTLNDLISGPTGCTSTDGIGLSNGNVGH